MKISTEITVYFHPELGSDNNGGSPMGPLKSEKAAFERANEILKIYPKAKITIKKME